MDVNLWKTGSLPRECDLAIVGGGFAGLTSLVRALQQGRGWRVVVVERHPHTGPGIAYGGCDSHHLLNVPAARMGAFTEDAGGFHSWLERTQAGRFAGSDFVPRALFGAYIDEVVGEALAALGGAATAPQNAAAPTFGQDVLVRAEPIKRHVDLLFGSGDAVRTRALLMAPGLPTARTPWRAFDEEVPLEHLAPDPWAPAALQGIASDAPVVIVGSGLTAVDIVSALRRRGHAGRITLLSRSGRLPLPHADGAATNPEYDRAILARGAREALRTVREAAKELRARGLPWQGALDGLRPLTTTVWSSWSTRERTRFMRHIRPLWEIHRHRAPRALLDDLAAQQRSGSLAILRGSVRGLRVGPKGVILVAHSGNGASTDLPAARVINCTGPAQGIRDTADPLISSLLQSGTATTDDLGIGLHTDSDGRLVGREGRAQERIYLVGALRRGDLWESTAVPELRTQVTKAVDGISALLAQA
jgi:uncharacterized NAD(P)/FAD-binding protein YdhS